MKISVTTRPPLRLPTGCHRLQLWYGLCLLLAIATYFFGLDSLHIPRNGDECIYMQITRLTAYSGHLLPLQSHPEMRNTKPPLLFWQGILSTRWARDWHPWSLRYPSVIYTLRTRSIPPTTNTKMPATTRATRSVKVRRFPTCFGGGRVSIFTYIGEDAQAVKTEMVGMVHAARGSPVTPATSFVSPRKYSCGIWPNTVCLSPRREDPGQSLPW